MKSKRVLSPKTLFFLTLSLAMLVTLALPCLSGSIAMAEDEDEIPFEVADVYAELNNTDGDLGFHATIDGEPWKYLKIEDPRERVILWVSSMGRLRRQGLTEFSFESAEPPFDSDEPGEVTQTPEEFFRRFRSGWYEIESRTLEGDEQESEDLFWHVMPAPPDGIIVSGTPIDPEEVDCDSDVPGIAAGVHGDVIISWDPVETSHEEIGTPDVDVEVALYEVVVEEEESGLKLSFELPSDQTSVTVPADFIALGEEFKFEILVKEATGGNQTAVESCFEVD